MRRVYAALAFLAAPVLMSAMATATSGGAPDFTGNWRLDPAKSEPASAGTITLAIQDQAGGKIQYQRTLRETNGRETVLRFTCPADGSQCDFDEDGHKAKVSLWYDGSALVILKTEGRKEDETTERRLQLSADGRTLTVQFTNVAANGKPEKLVFTKEAASSAPGQ